MPLVPVGQVTFCFPDEIRPKPGLRTAAQQAFAFALRGSILPPTTTVWYPHFPDVLARRPRLVPQQNSPSSQTFSMVVPTFGWQTAYPSILARWQYPVAAQQATWLGVQATIPQVVQWLPTYPVLHWTTGIRAPWHLTTAQNLEPLPNAPSPDAAWLPSYPDQVWPTVTLRTSLQQPWASDRIRPESPDLAWRVIAPDQIIRAKTHPALHTFVANEIRQPPAFVQEGWTTTFVDVIRRALRLEGLQSRTVETPVSPIVWLAERMDPPDAPRPRPTMLAQETAAPLSVFQTTAAALAWHAFVPTPVRARAPLIDLPFPVQPVLPPGPETWCIRLSREAIIPTKLDEEVLLLPTFAEEDVSTPRLATEENC